MKQKKHEHFFVILPIGFESEFVHEMVEIWHLMLDLDGQPTNSILPEMVIEKGGVSFSTELHLGLQVNLFSKLASRVLLRVSNFFVLESYEFEREIKKIKFPVEFIKNGFQLKVSCSSSQLNNEKKVSSIVANNYKIKDESENHVFIRIFENRCLVSLDTSGEHLHRRGQLVKRGEAPLRENIANFAIRKLIQNYSIGDLRKVIFFDPVMGSGTFLSEGANIFRVSNRNYAFQVWSLTPSLLKTLLFLKNYKHLQDSPFASFIGNDIDEKHFQIACENLVQLDKHQLFNEDLFNLSRSQIMIGPDQQLWVFCNPPYGLRIQGIRMPLFFKKMAELNVQRLAVIYPKINKEDLIGTDFQITQYWPIENGGLKINLTLIEKI